MERVFFSAVLLAIFGSVVAADNFDHLGDIEGKSYYTSNETKTWHEARIFCQLSGGLRLGSITSQTQHDFLVSKQEDLGGQWHWTAGRDALTEQQFVWDHTPAVTVLRFGGGMSGVPIRTALAFVVTGGGPPYVGYYYGFILDERFRVLCERVQ